MTIRTYFTFTYLHLGGESFYTPRYVFDNNFAGLDVSYRYVAGDYHKDSRHLAFVEYTGDLPAETVEALYSERLALYGFHAKTEAKALEFLRYVTWNEAAELPA